jgi:hypothetical protein
MPPSPARMGTRVGVSLADEKAGTTMIVGER